MDGDIVHAPPVGVAPARTATRVHLRLIATTDVHLHLLPYDYVADKPTGPGGLVAAEPRLSELRRGAANALLFDNGDLLQGGPMGDRLARQTNPDTTGQQIHPAIRTLNRLGYDAATLGNHEFDFGLDFLRQTLDDAKFPVVCANLVVPGKPERTIFPPYTVLTRDCVDAAGGIRQLRIGVIGFLPPQTAGWAHQHLGGRAETRGIADAARRYVPELSGKADVVIALCHSGLSADESDHAENAALALARVPGLDAIFAGHTHQIFPNGPDPVPRGADRAAGTLHGVPAAMGGSAASHLAVIDIWLEQRAGRWRRIGHRANAVAAQSDARPGLLARSLNAELAQTHDATLDYIRRPLGVTKTPIHDHLAPIGVLPGVALVLEAQLAHLRRMMPDADRPLLSAAAPSQFRLDRHVDVAPGPISVRDVSALYAYQNAFVVIEVTGAELRAWLAQSARVFAQIDGRVSNQPLLVPDIALYNLDAIGPLDYRIDLAAAPDDEAGRIRDLRHAGRAVADNDLFFLATNSYRLAGGGGFPGAPRARAALACTNFDICMRHVAEASPLSPSAAPLWQLDAPAGASGVFDTGVGVLSHLAATGDPRIEVAGHPALDRVRLRLRF